MNKTIGALYCDCVDCECQTSEIRYRRLFESAKDGILILEAGNGTIIEVNPFLVELLGYPKEWFLGKNLWEIGLFDDIMSSKKAFRELQDKTYIRYEDLPLKTADGRKIDVEFISNVYSENDGKVIQCNIRDNTEKIKLAETIRRNQKLESLGVLAGGIAHDFNNLLAGIFGYLELARIGVTERKPHEIEDNIAKAFLVFERTRALTRQLLTFSKGGAPCRTTVNMVLLIRESVQFALSGTNVIGQFDFADDLWSSNCDANQISQAISNLVINASQSMPTGGTIHITADNISIAAGESGHSGGVTREGKFVRFSIKDTGSGIPKEIMERIFDPFFSTKDTGHGLGLATVFSIIRRHGGWVNVESEPGTGSIFTVFIPASEVPPPTGSGQIPAEHHGNGAVLVMDDEKFMIDVITGMLTKCGYSVLPAEDGHEALMLFMQAEESGKPFKACILDLTIKGGMGGRDTLAAIRNICPESTVIASSGYSEDPIMSHPSEFGFSGSIVKPFRRDDLLTLFNRLFEPEYTI